LMGIYYGFSGGWVRRFQMADLTIYQSYAKASALYGQS
jgi:hypothetical protein